MSDHIVKKKVLIVEIVEDEISLLNVLSEKFKNEGFGVLEAKNGQEGLKIALAEHPDMILLDIIMPVMDGMTMLKKLREDAWGKDAKVIILTNLSDNATVAEAGSFESHEYLVKSDWKIDDVVAKVKEKLKK